MPETNASPLPRRSILSSWFSSEPGQALIAGQKAALDTLVPDQFYRVGMQFGLNDHPTMLEMNVEQAIYCDIGRAFEAEAANSVVALPEALPLADSSVDLALLFHTLDFCDNPHRVLREVSQVLSPEGVLVLTGFHPFSLWGAERYINKKRAPFDARFISRSVVQGWLELLGFQSLTGRMLNYQLPQLNESWRNRLEWMNKMGDRWWPTLGAVYILVVQKKIYSGVGIKNASRKGRRWFPELKPAQAKIAQQSTIKNRNY